MTTEHQLTPEEEAFDRLLDEKWSLLSEEARELLGRVRGEAYGCNLVRTYGYQPLEYFMAMEDMLCLAGELGDQDREFVAEVGGAAAAAAAALDPEDERPAGYRRCKGDVHYYYGMVADMIEEALRPKTDREREEARWKLWKDYADWEKRVDRDSAKARQRAPVQVPLDTDDIP